MKIVLREEWSDTAPSNPTKMHPNRRDRIFVHWPAMPPQMSDMQMLLSALRYHTGTKGWSDIAYSVALGTDGTMYVLRGPNVAGGHTKGENDDSYAILVLTGIGEKPTQEQLDAFPHVVEWLRNEDSLLGEREDIVVLGHQHDDEASTSCPGPDWAEFALAYNHKRDYPAGDPIKEDKDNDMNNETQIRKLYNDILGREADETGLEYWVGQMEDGTPLGAISHEFLTVRLAADKAVTEALVKRIDSGTGVTATVIAEQTYRLFLENMQALTA